MNAICLVVDRLHAGYVGCYGNTWIATPELNRLGAESFVFDQAMIDTPNLKELYHSWWLGLHALARPGGEVQANRPSLARLLAAAGVATTLVSDSSEVCAHPLARDFADVIQLDLAEALTADEVEQTHLAGFFAAAAESALAARQPFCLWLHTQGLGAPWDAPLEFRNRYVDEDEPLPPNFAVVPCRVLPEDFDPDERLGITQAYAGQVTLLDLCIGGLVELLREGALGAETLLALVSARGFPLGEHRRIGAVCKTLEGQPAGEALYGELAHVPLLIRFPDGLGAADRSQSLVQPPDLCATLLDWWGIRPQSGAAPAAGCGEGMNLLPVIRGEIEALRDRACILGARRERGIRTPAWYLRLPDDVAIPAGGERDLEADRAGRKVGRRRSSVRDASSSARGELFAKPDDRWEVNNMAQRLPDIVVALDQALVQFEQAAQSGEPCTLPRLEEPLISGVG